MNVSDSIQVPSGVLLIDKARDMTSHDVVAIARRSLGIKKIGHCGTLAAEIRERRPGLRKQGSQKGFPRWNLMKSCFPCA